MIPLPSYSLIADLLKKGATLEAQEQIMKLREAALQQQEENLRLCEELRKAEAEVRVLEAKLDSRRTGAELRVQPDATKNPKTRPHQGFSADHQPRQRL